MSLESLKGIKLTLDLDDSAFTKALNKVMKHVSAFQKDLNELNKALKLDPKNTELLASKTALLHEKEQETLGVLQKMQETLKSFEAKGIDDADRRMVGLRTRIVQANEELKKTREELRRAATGFGNLSEFFEKTGEASAKAAKATAALAATSSGALVAAGKAAIDYEKAFANVRKTIDETDTTSYQDLSAAIVEMSKSVPTTAKDIAELVGIVGQLGVSADDAIKFTKTMVDLGNSTNLSATEAGTEIAQFYNMLGSDIDTVDRFASALVHLGNNTATTEKDIMNLATYFGAAGSSIGLAEDQILGVAAALSSVGLDTYGATALSTILRQIDIQVDTNGKKLKDWAKIVGMTNEEFSKSWNTNTIEVIKRLFEALGNVEDQGGSLTATLDELGLKNLRQLDTVTRLANASELLSSTLQLSATAWKDGNYAIEEANKMYGTTASQMEIMRNRIQATAISLGNTLLPTVSRILGKIEPMVEGLAKWVAENQNLVVSLLGVGATISPVLLGVSQMSKGIVTVLKWAQMGVPLVTKLSVVLGGVALAISGIVAVTTMAKSMEREEDEVLRQLIEDNERYNQTLADNYGAKDKELEHYRDLAEELGTLYEANGKVKEGYEERVSFIKSELINAGIIEEETLNKLVGKQNEYEQTINDTIEAQRVANAMSFANEQETQALQNQQEALKWITDHASEIEHAKAVLNGEVSGVGGVEVSNAKQIIEDYEKMNELYANSNVILDNVNAMREAYENKEWETVIQEYNKGVYELVGKGEDDVLQELTNMSLELDTLKEQDDGTPLFAALIDRTVQKFNDMVTAAGYSVSEIERMLGVAQTAQSALNGISSQMVSAGEIVNNRRSSGYRSGGFASGGFTMNSTINVSTTQTITTTDVRRWGITLADVINEELGKRL